MQYVKSESKTEADIIVTSQMGESVKYIMISRAFYPVLNWQLGITASRKLFQNCCGLFACIKQGSSKSHVKGGLEGGTAQWLEYIKAE